MELSADTLDQTELNTAVDAYFAQLAAGVFNPELNKESQIKAAYTAMHGVGYPAIVRAFQVANFEVNLNCCRSCTMTSFTYSEALNHLVKPKLIQNWL